jgi:hypothetical protein
MHSRFLLKEKVKNNDIIFATKFQWDFIIKNNSRNLLLNNWPLKNSNFNSKAKKKH